MRHSISLILLALILGYAPNLYSQDCSHGTTTSTKGNKLYLYFPTTDDASFPSTIVTLSSGISPLEAFDIADLDASVGSTNQLSERIFEIATLQEAK